MQRLYTMFPTGIPGVGLLILRLSVAAVQASHVSGSPDAWAPSGLLLIPAAFVTAGLFTPLMAIACGTVEGVLLITAVPFDLGHAVGLAQALTLAMLGPGAQSLDARRFGRRLLVTSASA